MSESGRGGDPVVAFGTYDVRKHPRFGVILEGLREHGVEIEEINRPLGLSTAERVRMLKEPWRAVGLGLRLLRIWLGLTAAALRRRGGRPQAVLVGYLGHFDVLLARVLFPRSTIVLDQLIFGADTASDRRATAGPLLLALRLLDRLSVAAADVVVVDTEHHRALIPAAARDRGMVVPVGAPSSWFDQPAAAPADQLRVIFYGLFTPLQGTTHIADALAELHADGVEVAVTMVGDGQDGAEVRSRLSEVDVRWLSWVEPEQLPALVAEHDVCLGIFGDTPKASRVVPNKVYQGLAAGLAVVTSETEPQREALADAAEYVPAGDGAALAQALRRLSADPGRVDELRGAARRRAQRFAPGAIVAPLLERIR